MATRGPLAQSGWSARFTSESLASASEDETVKVWDTVTGKEVLTLKGHTFTVGSVSFSPDGKRIVSGGYDKTVKVWDLPADGKSP